MKTPTPGTLLSFAVGAGTALACLAAGASFAGQAPEQADGRASQATSAPMAALPAAPAPLITSACANKKSGVVTIKAAKHKKCVKGEKAIRFATITSPTPSILGADGSLELLKGVRFTSPNGAYQLVLTDDGVGLKGPGGALLIDAFKVKEFDGGGRLK